jgi:nucleotide-binding universal stress UspA family protein
MAMNILIGVNPDDAGDDALALGAVLARLTSARIVLTHIHPPPFEFPSLSSVDAEWMAFVEERAFAVTERARIRLATDWGVTDVHTCIRSHQSRGRGLLAAEKEFDARIVVIGPAPGAPKGKISLGSMADRLLHGSSAAVALAPEGYRESAPEHIDRLVVGFRGTEESELAVQTALRLVAGAPDQTVTPLVHLLTIIVRSTRIMGSRAGRNAEDAMLDRIAEFESNVQQDFIANLVNPDVKGSVVRGDNADRALSRFDWQDSDMFVLASSTEGPLHRVVMGDMTHRLLRNSDVPALVLPRLFELRNPEDNS